MKQIILFIMTFLFVFIVYRLFLIGKSKRRNSKKKPIEVNYLVSKYNLDLKKVNYKSLLMVISIVSSLDISIIVTLVLLINNYLLELLVALVLVIPIILVSYSFVGKYYIKKGMIKDD